MSAAELLWEFLRFVALVEFAIIYGFTIRIIQRYYHARRLSRGGLGLLPSHVWMIGVAYLSALPPLAAHMVELLDQPPQWDALPFGLTTGTLGSIALWRIYQFEGTRLRKGRDEVTVVDPRGDGPPVSVRKCEEAP